MTITLLVAQFLTSTYACIVSHGEFDRRFHRASWETFNPAEEIDPTTYAVQILTVRDLIAVFGFLFFMFWLHRAQSNLPALGARELRFTPGWAVGWFWVPVFSFFRPFQVMSETWRGSDPAGANKVDGKASQRGMRSGAGG